MSEDLTKQRVQKRRALEQSLRELDQQEVGEYVMANLPSDFIGIEKIDEKELADLIGKHKRIVTQLEIVYGKLFCGKKTHVFDCVGDKVESEPPPKKLFSFGSINNGTSSPTPPPTTLPGFNFQPRNVQQIGAFQPPKTTVVNF